MKKLIVMALSMAFFSFGSAQAGEIADLVAKLSSSPSPTYSCNHPKSETPCEVE